MSAYNEIYGNKRGRSKSQIDVLACARKAHSSRRASISYRENVPPPLPPKPAARVSHLHGPKITAPLFFPNRKPLASMRKLSIATALNDDVPWSSDGFCSPSPPLATVQSSTNSQSTSPRHQAEPTSMHGQTHVLIPSSTEDEHLPPSHHRKAAYHCLSTPVKPCPPRPPALPSEPAHMSRKRRRDDDSDVRTEVKKLRSSVKQLKRDKDSLCKQKTRRDKMIQQLKTKHGKLMTENRAIEARLAIVVRNKEQSDARADQADEKIKAQQVLLERLYAKLRAAAVAGKRREEAFEQRLRDLAEELLHPHLMDRGRWSDRTRHTIRKLFNAGCAIRKIGGILVDTADLIGITLDHVPSARTIVQIIVEGGVIAELQIVHELMNCSGEPL